MRGAWLAGVTGRCRADDAGVTWGKRGKGRGRGVQFAGRTEPDPLSLLLAQGIGDAQRVGIVGHSFGGYSTLLGLTFQPELFKVGMPPSLNPMPACMRNRRW